jgi:hypothetical protein
LPVSPSSKSTFSLIAGKVLDRPTYPVMVYPVSGLPGGGATEHDRIKQAKIKVAKLAAVGILILIGLLSWFGRSHVRSLSQIMLATTHSARHTSSIDLAHPCISMQARCQDRYSASQG